mgnify:CR=1 FL=1
MKQSKEHVRINRLPMSAQQKNIWEMMKKYEGTCLGNIGGFLELQGDIEKEKIRQVLQKIQYLNAALRLCVDETGNLYLQDSSDVDFCIVDCRKFTDFQTKEYIQKEMNTSLFKSNQVLVRYKLFQQREKSYLLGIYHHLISGFAIYRRFENGKFSSFRSKYNIFSTVDGKFQESCHEICGQKGRGVRSGSRISEKDSGT